MAEKSEKMPPKIICKKGVDVCENCSAYIMRDVETCLQCLDAGKLEKTQLCKRYKKVFRKVLKKNIIEQEDVDVEKPLEPLNLEMKHKFDKCAIRNDKILIKVSEMRREFPKCLTNLYKKESKTASKTLNNFQIDAESPLVVSVPDCSFSLDVDPGLPTASTVGGFIEEVQKLQERIETQKQVNEALENQLFNSYNHHSPGKRRLSRRQSMRK